MNLKDLRLRLRALFARRRVEQDLHDELAFHIERETQAQIARGVDPAVARAAAHARFGSVALAADNCRDEQGTSFIDGLLRDIAYALRTYRRAPLVAATIVGTVALGLGLVTVVFTFFNAFFFRVDTFARPHEVFAVERPQPGGEPRRFTRPEYEALRRDTSVFSDVFAMLPDINSRIEGRTMEGTLVTGNFFDVLDIAAARGRALRPDDDRPGTPRPVIVLSHAGWTRLFASDPNLVGQSLIVSGAPVEVVGIMPAGFRGASLSTPDYWAPLALLGQFRPIHAGREDLIAIEVAGRLAPGMSRRTAAAGLAVWDSGRSGATRHDSIVLKPRTGALAEVSEGVLVFSPIFFAFGLVLAIGCANVANLLLARGLARQREIGIRLSLGASRRRLLRQLITESLLLALLGAAGGYLVSRLALGAAYYALTSTLPVELADALSISIPAADWRVAVFLVAGAVASTLFFGLAPAIQATRLELSRTIRGEITRDARPGRARNALIAMQVGASALLLVVAGVFLRSALAASTQGPGLRTADTMLVDIVSEPLRPALLTAIRSHEAVASIAAALPSTMDRPREALVEGGALKGRASYRMISPEYFAVLDVPVVLGRTFTAAEGSAPAPVAMITEKLASEMWPGGDAVGQILRLEQDPNSPTRNRDEPLLAARAYTVIGVVRDIPGFRLAEAPEAAVYLPTTIETAATDLILRVHGDPDRGRRALLDRLTPIDPNLGEIITLRTLSRLQAYILGIGFWTALVVGALALMLTVSGLFSVLSYLVEQRTREIGVRMALGATARDVALLVLAQSARPVALGVVAGAGLAGLVAALLLLVPESARFGVEFFDPLAYIGSVGCILTACALAAFVPALSAARVDPATTLRHD